MPLYICTWAVSWQGINLLLLLLLLLFRSSHASLDTCSVTQMDLNWVIIHLIECRGAESCSASALQEEEVTNEELQYGAPSLTSELWAQIHVHLLYLVILYLLFINGTKTVLYYWYYYLELLIYKLYRVILSYAIHCVHVTHNVMIGNRHNCYVHRCYCA